MRDRDPNRPPEIERASWLAPFRVGSFRFQWPADLATSWAFEMETLILGWYVLVETGSVLLLTLFATLQFVGTLVAPVFGLAGDRLGHRNVLCGMRATYAALAAALTALAFLGALGPAAVLVIAALSGLVRPSDLVMRNALVGETMTPGLLMGAMGISRTTADSARVAGALAGAGLMASLGMAPAYLMITVLYVASLLLTLGVARGPARPPGAAETAPRASPWPDLVHAGAYVWAAPHLLAAMYLAFLVNLTAFPVTNGLLPYVAKEIYGTDQTGLAWLVASFALGALVGSIGLSRHRGVMRPARMMIVFAVAWYAALIAMAHTESTLAGIATLMVAGFMQSLCLVPLAVMLLRCSDPQLRGRVMGLRMLAVYGLPLGLLAAGPLIQAYGFAWTATLAGVVGLACTLVIGWYWRRHVWRIEAPANAG
ncbi:MAG: MFS transporter [Alphaproteobacteria bacterium]|nr:MFS transporter [Alphaproteobacteria bacterium]